MARLFGALANAGAQANTNRFKRQQYDDQQAAQAREEARRVFEFAALQKDRQEQAKAAAQEREQSRLFQAQEAGYADAPDVAGVRAGGAAMAAMGGFHTNAEQAVAQEDAPFQREMEGVQYQAPKVASQYLTIGGKTLRKNRQSEANAAKDAEAQKFMAQVVMNKDIKSQLQMQRDIAAGGRADAAKQTREIVAGIAAASRPQPQEKKDLWTDGKGTYLRLGMDDPIPAGFQPVRSGGAGAGGGKPVTKGERDALSGIQEIRRLAQDAATKMEGVDNFSGPIDRRVEGFKTLVGNPNMARVEAMRAYQRLASPAARQTIGTAMTPQEIKRLDQWLPMLESTDERVIRSGVQNFFREADAIYKERLQFMKASGINTDALEGLPAQFDAMAKVALPPAGASDRGRQPAPAPQSGGVKVPWTTKKGS